MEETIDEMSLCNGEMEQGFLQGMERLAWVKKPYKVSLLPKQG